MPIQDMSGPDPLQSGPDSTPDDTPALLPRRREEDRPMDLDIDLRSGRLGEPPLPTWLSELRPQQREIIPNILSAFRTNDLVFLQAPPGAGKTAIAEIVRRLLPARRTTYMCSTKTLMDQVASDFPYASLLKGRANYPTARTDQSATCADCTWTSEVPECVWCPSLFACPFQEASRKAVMSPLAVTNTSFFLLDGNYGKSRLSHRNLTVVDECDTLEGHLLSLMEVVITPYRQKMLGIVPPKAKTATAKSNDWASWVDHVALPKARRHFLKLDPVADRNEFRFMNGFVTSLETLSKELPAGGWVYDGYDRDYIIFRPVSVRRYGNNLLWPHGSKFLLMSGTILSGDMMADELGFAGSWEMLDVSSDVPVEQRPIHYVPVADMTAKKKQESWPKMLAGVLGVAKRHPNDRILVHAVSYELSSYLHSGLDDHYRRIGGRRVFTYHDAGERDAALRRFKESPKAILVASSMDRGVDLPGDLCRVQVVAKIPHLNLGDKRINARLYSRGGQAWYRLHGIRTLIQMTGRAVRSSSDSAVTYILDEQFYKGLWKGGSGMFPKWWKEAVNWRFPRHLLMRRDDE